MVDLSTLITIGYLVIGVLVIRRLFKSNGLMRCPNCKRFGTMVTTYQDQPMLEENQQILDMEELPIASSYTCYKCKNCEFVTTIS